MLQKDHGLPLDRCVIVDLKDLSRELAPLTARGVVFHQRRISRENLPRILGLARVGDVIIDLTVNVDSVEMVEACQARGLRYINAAVEVWDPFVDAPRRSPQERTLYYRQSRFQDLRSRGGGPSALLDHGANPGLGRCQLRLPGHGLGGKNHPCIGE